MNRHPLSAIYGSMTPSEFDDIKASIKKIGVQEPVAIFEGEIIDGWHRYLASQELGVECPQVDVSGVDPREFVIAKNSRRNLNASQRALYAASAYEWMPNGSHAPDKLRPQGVALQNATQPKSAKEIADIAGVAERSIQRAKTTLTHASDDVIQSVKDGKIGLKKAEELSKLPISEQAEAINRPMKRKLDETPVVCVDDVAAEKDDLIAHLIEENEALKDRLASGVLVGTEEEKLLAAQTIEDLRNELKDLTINYNAVRDMRDAYQEENAQLKRQVKMMMKAGGK